MEYKFLLSYLSLELGKVLKLQGHFDTKILKFVDFDLNDKC